MEDLHEAMAELYYPDTWGASLEATYYVHRPAAAFETREHRKFVQRPSRAADPKAKKTRKLSEEQIRFAVSSKLSQGEIARQLGVTQQSISYLRRKHGGIL